MSDYYQSVIEYHFAWSASFRIIHPNTQCNRYIQASSTRYGSRTRSM